MPKIQYVDMNISAEKRARIAQANAIIVEYQQQGFVLTLRQLYYQHVARGLIPNKQTEYARLGDLISDARLAGLVDWSAIEDRTRELETNPQWDGPEDIVQACSTQFNLDLWSDQEVRPEVWIEKDALLGVIEPTCRELHVSYFSCRGYTSQSSLWQAGRRLRAFIKKGQRPVIFHLGDHDPSGIDMTRDIIERVSMFAESRIEVKRLALNMDQIEEFDPPPNPAKLTDSRAQGYIAEHGDQSWELDAIEPVRMARLITEAVEGVRDEEKWEARVAERDEGRATIKAVADRWDEVKDFVS